MFHMIGLDLFTGNKFEHMCKVTGPIVRFHVPNVTKKDYKMVSFEGESISLNVDGETVAFKMSANVEWNKESFEDKIARGELATVLAACGESMVIGFTQG